MSRSLPPASDAPAAVHAEALSPAEREELAMHGAVIERHRNLAAKIIREVAAAEAERGLAVEHALSSMDHYIRAGEWLLEAKVAVKRDGGDWLPWVRANLPFSEDTAEAYMRVARNSERVRNCLSLRQALTVLAKPKRTAWQATIEKDIVAFAPQLSPELRGYIRALDAALAVLADVERGEIDLAEYRQEIVGLRQRLVEQGTAPDTDEAA